MYDITSKRLDNRKINQQNLTTITRYQDFHKIVTNNYALYYTFPLLQHEQTFCLNFRRSKDNHNPENNKRTNISECLLLLSHLKWCLHNSDKEEWKTENYIVFNTYLFYRKQKLTTPFGILHGCRTTLLILDGEKLVTFNSQSNTQNPTCLPNLSNTVKITHEVQIHCTVIPWKIRLFTQ